MQLGEEVQAGRLAPAQADAELSKLGLDPFEHTPDPATFDPMQETHWSVVMTLAWIVWRAPEPVREVWDAYRAETVRWLLRDRTAPCEGGAGPRVNRIERVLENPGKAEVRHLFVMEGLYRGGQCSLTEADRLLLQELRAGRITAEGRDTSTLTRRSITPQEWRNDMYFREIDHGPSPVRAESRTGGGARYDDLLFERADVVRIWAPDSNARQRVGATRSAEPSSAKQPQSRNARRLSVLSAVKALWPDGPPRDITAGQRDAKINDWLKEHDRPVVHSVTIKRALDSKDTG